MLQSIIFKISQLIKKKLVNLVQILRLSLYQWKCIGFVLNRTQGLCLQDVHSK